VRAPFGAALPYDGDATAAAAAGSYMERLAPRLEAAFGGLVASLAGRRLELLGRESVPERRLSAYEFAREVGKFAPAAARFVAEVCRPLQLGVAPRLRGFYFVGARPVVVGELAPAAAAAAAPAAAAALASNATHAFATVRAPAAPHVSHASGAGAVPYGAPYGPPATRRVPEWTFLDGFFPDVVLADRGGRRRRARRRAGGGAPARAARRRRRGRAGAGGARRAVVGQQPRPRAAHRRGGARGRRAPGAARRGGRARAAPGRGAAAARRAAGDPRHDAALPGRRRAAALGLGLWQGDTLGGDGRRVWLEGYRRQLHGAAWAALADSLRALPDAPRRDDDYGRAYARLKTYVVGTEHPERSTVGVVAPVLFASWQRDLAVDAETAALARRQFEFFARELPRHPRAPWREPQTPALVSHARSFLGQFAGAERIYQAMLAEGSAGAPAARLADVAALAPGVVAASSDVPGAFTDSGWARMQRAFRDADRYFTGERWVVGDATAAQAQDRDRVLAELRARYRAEYVDRWRGWLRGLAVVPSSSPRDAVQKLGTLGGPGSPLLAALALAARHTRVDTTTKVAFQPVHKVTPPGAAQFVGESNQAYASALIGLQGAVAQVANLPSTRDSIGAAQLAQAGQQGLPVAAQARVAAGTIAQKFAVDSAAAPAAAVVQELLIRPIADGERHLLAATHARPPAARPAALAGGGAPPAAAPPPPADGATLGKLNARGAAFCAALAPVLAKFPFAPDGREEATLAEVGGLLAPETGQLWAFYHEMLAPYLDKQGERYAPRAGAPAVLSPAFVAFFNRAARTSEALYDGAAEPRLTVNARSTTPKRAVVLSQGNQVAKFGRNAPPFQFNWPSASGREAKLSVSEREFIILGKTRTVARAGGEWALFRLVAQAAKWEQAGPNQWRAEWNAGGPVSIEFAFPKGFPVLQRGWLGSTGCVPQVAR
jgi:type VI secretion system protein ImpL